MRISDWSSDVCSSDLPGHRAHNPPAALRCPAATDQQRNSTMLDRSDPPIRLYAILTVPGLENSGPAHWQSLWEDSDPACTRVELGQWDRPHRNSWVRRLNEAIAATDRPVLLAALSLGCHAVAWWGSLEPWAGARRGDRKSVGAGT